MERALVIGGDGRLGKALCKILARAGVGVVATTRRRTTRAWVASTTPPLNWVHLDMLEPTIVAAPAAPRTVFIVAAVTGFGPCERGGDSWRVNADAPGIIARQCLGRTIFVSSDAVEFAPHTAYAKQKAYAELAVLAAGGRVLRSGPIAPDLYADVARALVELADASGGTLRRWP